MDIEKVIPIKIGKLNDLVRLATSISTPQSMLYILKFREDNRIVLGILGVFRDYYKYYGLPIFYYYVVEGKEAGRIKEANYIVFSTSDERIEFSKYPKPGLSIPMITLAEKPSFIPELK